MPDLGSGSIVQSVWRFSSFGARLWGYRSGHKKEIKTQYINTVAMIGKTREKRFWKRRGHADWVLIAK